MLKQPQDMLSDSTWMIVRVCSSQTVIPPRVSPDITVPRLVATRDQMKPASSVIYALHVCNSIQAGNLEAMGRHVRVQEVTTQCGCPSLKTIEKVSYPIQSLCDRRKKPRAESLTLHPSEKKVRCNDASKVPRVSLVLAQQHERSLLLDPLSTQTSEKSLLASNTLTEPSSHARAQKRSLQVVRKQMRLAVSRRWVWSVDALARRCGAYLWTAASQMAPPPDGYDRL